MISVLVFKEKLNNANIMMKVKNVSNVINTIILTIKNA